jgi:hypothetical protein
MLSVEELFDFFVWNFNVNNMTRVISTNVLDEGLRIGGIGRQMNSKVKIS